MQRHEVTNGLRVTNDQVKWCIAPEIHPVDVESALDQQLAS